MAVMEDNDELPAKAAPDYDIFGVQQFGQFSSLSDCDFFERTRDYYRNQERQLLGPSFMDSYRRAREMKSALVAEDCFVQHELGLVNQLLACCTRGADRRDKMLDFAMSDLLNRVQSIDGTGREFYSRSLRQKYELDNGSSSHLICIKSGMRWLIH